MQSIMNDNFAFNVRFIKKIRENIWLIDKKDHRYRNKNLKAAKWKQIAQQLNFKDVQSIKRKWKFFWSHYLLEKELEKTYGRLRVLGKSKWKYFQYLSFLEAYVKIRQNSEICQVSVTTEGSSSDMDSNGNDYDYVDDDANVIPSIMANASDREHLSPPKRIKMEEGSSKANIPKLKGCGMIKMEEGSSKANTSQLKDCGNSDLAFCNFVLSEMGGMSKERKRKFKSEVSTIIFKHN